LGIGTIQELIASRIPKAVNDLDKRDWEFIDRVQISDSYDLASGTRVAFQQLKPYRSEVERLLHEGMKNPAFQTVDLDDLFA